ncbi:ChbG/HpnK family deacetylase [Arenibacter algicola]|uniref:Chitooligosaccharide deacetylase ChbG n=1 Tax=Arenibacter algicola TaxID=616991 RepID=A0A221V3N1_9FLAO|nr:ChbG/HpnK family deacetylase [Arenibacter algicola]ASO07976.1 chitooligosaccharide deacetylase ChbG [Arenibacter algicola]
MKLIVNADDFGFSQEVNSNIIKCHLNGIVSSATILAGGDQFQDAVDLAKKHKNLGIGVHLALDGPNNIGKEYVSLLDPHTGVFYEDLIAVKKIKHGAYLHKEMIAEYSLQIEKVINSGIQVTHLDHHHHLHLYFPVLKAVIEVAKKYNIKYIRPQKILYQTKTSFAKKVYRLYHHHYLINKSNSVDGYTSLLGCNNIQMREKLKSILNSNKETIELVVHPLEENGELNFLRDYETIKMARNHILNYGDLK